MEWSEICENEMEWEIGICIVGRIRVVAKAADFVRC